MVEMSVDFHFCELFGSAPLNEKKRLNEECVNKVINAFPAKESTILKDLDILFLFDDKLRFQDPDELGAMILKGSLGYGYFKDDFSFEINKISNLSDYKYIIYIAKKTAEDDCEIFKSLTFAHELQHVLQDINFNCIRLRASVLHEYFCLKGILTPKIYREMPTERDAFIKSKKINYKIYSKDDINAFLDNKIHEIENRIKITRPKGVNTELISKTYWENIKDLAVDSNYNLEDEDKKFWKEHEENIEKEIIIIREKVKLEVKEKEFLDAYENYLKECK